MEKINFSKSDKFEKLPDGYEVNNRIPSLTEPGTYELPFVSYKKPGKVYLIVDVVFVSNRGRMQVIIIKIGNKYHDFYYNGGFKFLSEGDELTIAEWWKEEEVGEEVPDEFANIIAERDDEFKHWIY